MDHPTRPGGASHNPSFNMYDIKRKAHTASRRDSSGSSKYNPFRHVHHNSKRASTFDVESQSGQQQPDDELQQSQTAPASAGGILEERNSKEVEGGAGKAYGEDSEVYGSQVPTLTPGQSDLRNRNGNGSPISSTEEGDAHQDGPEDSKLKRQKTGKFFKHVEPKEPFTVGNQIQRTLFNSWINILILAAPAGIALNYTGISGQIVFAVNFIAIIPLAAMLGFATEEVALRTGETVGGLINATFGNAVELIVAIIALIEHKPLIVQTSLIGSILSNLLLVMGMSFFLGGLRRQEQFFNTTVAQTAASLLSLAAASVIVPTVFDYSASESAGPAEVAALSRGTSVILLVVYGSYLFFQLHTHQAVFNETSQKVAAKPFRKPGSKAGDNGIKAGLVQAGGVSGRTGIKAAGTNTENQQLSKMMMRPDPARNSADDDDDEEDPQLSLAVAFATLTVSTVIIAFCAEAMVGGIDAIVQGGVISEEFVGLILLPIVGNAAEHATAVTVAIKDKMDLAIGVAIGSSMQVALFLIPLLVIIGWGIGEQEMTLSFDLFQVAVMFVSVLLTNYLIADGKSHWLEGLLLICLYFIIAVCAWYYPAAEAVA